MARKQMFFSGEAADEIERFQAFCRKHGMRPNAVIVLLAKRFVSAWPDSAKWLGNDLAQQARDRGNRGAEGDKNP